MWGVDLTEIKIEWQEICLYASFNIDITLFWTERGKGNMVSVAKQNFTEGFEL